LLSPLSAAPFERTGFYHGLLRELAQCEKRLKLKLPKAFREYYEFAEKLSINTEHNILYVQSS